MTLTFQKTVTETKEVDIQFPAFFKDRITSIFYVAKNENTLLQISIHKTVDYFATQKFSGNEAKNKIAQLIENEIVTTEQEFNDHLIRYAGDFSDCLPEDTALSIFVNHIKEAV